MSKAITFYFSLLSPWVYFSGPRFQAIRQRTKAQVRYCPIDLFRVFRETGGTPLKDLHPSRKAYRGQERQRWSKLLAMPISEAPKFHPADEAPAASMILAWQAQQPDAEIWPLAQAILTAIWVEDRNIADLQTLIAIATKLGLDGAALLALGQQQDVAQRFQANTDNALADGVFGVPSFVIDGEVFFGQDRLDFVERALAE